MPTLNDYQAVAEARTKDELLDALLSVANQLDFGLLTSLLVLERPQQPNTVVSLANFPTGYADAANDPAASKRDPVLDRLRRLSVPIVWDQATYINDGAADLWDIQAPFGYRTGVAVCLHLPGARHFVLGIDREKALPKNDVRLTRLLADVQLLAVHAQDAAIRVLAPLAQPARVASLTRRETEVLRWTMLGKDTNAIAQILSLSPSTVKFHAENAIAKLGCETRHAAVLRAIEFGLLASR
ncbi:autoinducer binding domain-containing protein [Aquincola sp. S2]|uniref:Autoinducer binding domain-containing protein n=1 Tax=Pseudaquabacterium terrae TaxID=2732868 RepID=A0ABX2EQ08_9BURK|nr:LuxR family transcriptional regulator [Aquabacterium terrae]NRF70703.1 autoinducer binding domain-containing protein [Aquabacterium terrae]